MILLEGRICVKLIVHEFLFFRREGHIVHCQTFGQILRENSQTDFFPRNVLWTFGGRGFALRRLSDFSQLIICCWLELDMSSLDVTEKRIASLMVLVFQFFSKSSTFLCSQSKS